MIEADLVKLAIVAAIRTLLSVFLGREIAEIEEKMEQSAEPSVIGDSAR